MYKGTFDGSRVCVKRIRVFTEDDPKKASGVCFPAPLFPDLSSLMKLRCSIKKP